MGATLPPKEANLFKFVVKSYETKQYKKGLKAADTILKKYPDHGETLAMKGLTLNCMDRKMEAYELVRKGLKNDLKSHVCWHVYGLLYRSDREYREAIKCYRNALRIDPENIQILRDLSLLQAQMRDLGGFVETRRQLLTLKPNHRNNWIGFAIAQHISLNSEMAVQILDAYEGTLEDDFPPDNERYEHSEMLLFKVTVLEELGNPGKALEELNVKEPKIVDKLGLKEQRARLFLRLNRHEEAKELYEDLLNINPENYGYYEGLQSSLGLAVGQSVLSPDHDQVQRLIELYRDLAERYPQSSAAKRIPLEFLEGGAFKLALDAYVRPFLRKGVPSLFTDLRSLYKHPGKVDIIETLLTDTEVSLRDKGTFPSSLEVEAPSVIMWVLFLLAQHFDQKRQFDLALEKIDDALRHTPTAIDLYLVKGRIMKHAGDAFAASSLADEARSMDLADRYLNSECVKRMLQADQVDLAEKTALLFTKEGDQHNNLYDMQCIWYELASGDSYFRQGALGKALKKYLAVEKHYNDMVEDQFDFHTYCLRKMTLRAYVDMLRFQDHLHSHRYFHRATTSAIRCYLQLYDSPPKAVTDEEEAAVAGLSAVERKKYRQRLRKAEARAKKVAEDKVKEEDNNTIQVKGAKKSGQASKYVDDDPDGEKLLHTEDPLGEAVKCLKLLQAHSKDSLETHLLAFEVYIRRHKILLAFQAVKLQLKLSPDNPDVHKCLIRFFSTMDKLTAPETAAERLAQSVLVAERSSVKDFGEMSLVSINQNYLNVHRESLLHRVAAAEMLFLLDPCRKSEAVGIVEDSVSKPALCGDALTKDGIAVWKMKDCILVHKTLESTFQDADAAARWRIRCAELFPYSTYFRGAKSATFDEPYRSRPTSNSSTAPVNQVGILEKDISESANGLIQY